jgi:mevalonate kinase
VASSWGSSWGTSWGNSWGDAGVAPAVVPKKSKGGADYRRDPLVIHQRVEKATQELKRAVSELEDGKPKQARETIKDAHEQLSDAAIEIGTSPDFAEVSRLVQALQGDLSQIIRQRNIAAQALQEALEHARIIEMQLIDEEESIMFILMAAV